MLSFIVNILIASAVLFNIHHSFKNVSKQTRRFYKYYFIVLSFLLVVDNAFSFILYRIPHYQIFKICMFGWLSIPMGTGPHFIYNVYIKNIHNLFEGDIDSVIACFRGYYEQIKTKYNEMAKSSIKNGEVQIGFSKSSNILKEIKERICDSSDADVTTSVISELDEKEDKSIKID